MYADLVTAGRKRSVKERLNGGSAGEPSRLMFPNAKRQRQSEGILRYDTFKNEEPAIPDKTGDLRLKLQRKGMQKGTLSGSNHGQKLSGTMHQQPIKSVQLSRPIQQPVKSERLAELMHQHQVRSNLQKNKSVTAMNEPVQKSVPALKETPVVTTEKIPLPVVSSKISQNNTASSVDSFLQSLGLEKYSITFKAEEIDMTALQHMTDEDLKTIGLPMGPRKKILLALKSKSKT